MIQQIGVNKLRSGPARGAMAQLMGSERARIFYTDPPWGPGMMTYFQNLVEKDTGQPAERITYDELLRDLFQQAAQFTDGPIIVEYGTQWFDDVQAIGTQAGCRPLTTAVARYSGGMYHIHVFEPPTPRIDVRGLLVNGERFGSAVAAAKTGLSVAKAVVAPFAAEGAILVDLCSGYGLMAKAAKAMKMRFYGNELNPQRLARNPVAK